MTLKENTFENIVRKGENAGKQHFLLFPQFFSIQSKTGTIILAVFVVIRSLQMLSVWWSLNNCHLVKS